ncbi:hypothetical protein ACIBAG_06400 [Streptomyces sp. NPDC051243]|uniref:hypothetical protein n=1 Tax=Streptomyces sp. NPDC051243 TaxID=3365646 RepID=UPI0037A32B20
MIVHQVMNVTKRTIAVVALAGAAVMSTSALASADVSTIADSKAPTSPPTHMSLVYPYSAAYPPGILPLAAAPAVALLGVAPLGVL